MAKVTTTVDSVDIQRAKWAQQLTNKASPESPSLIMCVYLFYFPENLIVTLSVSQQFMYTDLATKQRAYFTPENETPIITHARKMKVIYSDVSLHRLHFFIL